MVDSEDWDCFRDVNFEIVSIDGVIVSHEKIASVRIDSDCLDAIEVREDLHGRDVGVQGAVRVDLVAVRGQDPVSQSLLRANFSLPADQSSRLAGSPSCYGRAATI